MKKKIILIFSGGGIKSLAHIGVLKVLREHKIDIAEYIGTSLGSLIAVMAASGMSLEEMEEIAISVRKKKFLTLNVKDLIQKRQKTESIYKGDTFRSFLDEVLPIQRFQELQKPAFVNAVNINTSQNVFWGSEGHDDISLSDAIYSSCALPGLFEPLEYDGHYYVDGGIGDNLPTDLATERGADLIIAALLGFRGGIHSEWNYEEEKGFISTILRANSIVIRNRSEESIKKCKVPLILIEPDTREYDLFSFTHIPHVISEGEEAARVELEGHSYLNLPPFLSKIISIFRKIPIRFTMHRKRD